MSTLSIKELVKDNKVQFKFYRKGELWYDVVNTVNGVAFTFPVPIDDCGDGQFNAEDKAIMFMRYIRKYLATMAEQES